MKFKTGNNHEYEVAVIGGGPAGTAAAHYAAVSGLRTILFEKQSYPREKPCGGALSERCVPLLGKHAVKAINSSIEAVHIYSPSNREIVCGDVTGRFVTRKEFDAAMAKDAQEAGVEIADHCAVETITPLASDGYEIVTGKRQVTARYVILASGLRKNTLLAPLGRREKFEKDYLAMCMVSETPIANTLVGGVDFSRKVLGIFFGAVPNGYGWYFVKQGYVNIGIGATSLFFKDEGRIKAYTAFIDRLKTKGFLPGELELAKARPYPLPFKRTARQTVFGNVLLVGDTAGFVSPVTGEGLYYAIKGGQIAAEVIYDNFKKGTPLAHYQKKCMNAFGKDLNKYGYFLRERLYKSGPRMELAVASGVIDKKVADLMKEMIMGMVTYRQTLVRIVLRIPITLVKAIYRKSIKPRRVMKNILSF